jgi:hypothetical protein
MKQFTIKKGNHYSTGAWTKVFHPMWDKNSWAVSFIITDDCYWDTPRNHDDLTDVNKLFGVGFGLNHHRNSWRLGWQPDFDRNNWFEIFMYTYDENGHVTRKLMDVKANKVYSVTVESKDNKYWFTCLDVGVMEYVDNINKDCGLQFPLYPYAGGDNSAIRDMTFFIDYKAI